MSLSKLKAIIKGKKYLPFEQDGKTYNLYELPKGFVIEGDLDLSNRKLTELPDLSDVVVKGIFSCSYNELTSLEGAPKEVGGDFDCSYNQLTSLKGAPKEVGGYFDCDYNGLTSLEGAPQKVGGHFDCAHNQLTSLEGAPEEVGRCFYCVHNQLTSLEGAPQTVGGHFECSYNKLTSLIGVPQLKENEKIYCDNSIGAKYGFSNEKNGIPYEDLCKSPLYRSEEAMNRIRIKQQQEQVGTKPDLTKQQEAFEKTNAEFSQWLKDNSNKPTRK